MKLPHCGGRLAYGSWVVGLVGAHVAFAQDGGITRYVENSGLDSPSCGSVTNPCRSIGRAIRLASDGDTILVGPGRYGDANLDGEFNDPGDEALDSTDPLFCLVCIRKRITLSSTHGAQLTIIDGAGTRSFGQVTGVGISAPGVVLGGPERGFTISDMGADGVSVQPTAGDVTIQGNVAARNGSVEVDPSGRGFAIWVGPGTTRVRGNIARDNRFYGFFVAHGGAGPGVARVLENTSDANLSSGFVISDTTGAGFTVLRNVATSNGQGFDITGDNHLVRENLAINNDSNGFVATGENVRLLANSTIGNRLSGFFFGPGLPAPATVRGNNIYGNAAVSSSTTEVNCGITNQAEQTIDARENYWGARSGPGPDPGDDAARRPLCDTNAVAQTIFFPFTRERFPIVAP